MSSTRELVRVVEEPAVWLSPGTIEARAADFNGDYPEGTSVAVRTGECPPELVIAALFGCRSGYGPAVAYYFDFTEAEVNEFGGLVEKRPADPPWPPAYDRAHHDITQGREAVAARMAQLHEGQRGRVVSVTFASYMAIMSDVLGLPEIHERFAKYGWKRVRKVLDGEPELWAELAKTRPHLLEEANTRKALRKLYSGNRESWNKLAEVLPVMHTDNVYKAG